MEFKDTVAWEKRKEDFAWKKRELEIAAGEPLSERAKKQLKRMQETFDAEEIRLEKAAKVRRENIDSRDTHNLIGRRRDENVVRGRSTN